MWRRRRGEPGGAVRVRVIGRVDGIDVVCGALHGRDDIEMVGWHDRIDKDALESLVDDVDVVLYGTEGPELDDDRLREVRAATPAPVILLAPASTPEVLEQALTADVADALLLPQPAEAVVFAVHRAVAARERATTRQGRVVTVFSPKGGSGKTAIALNFAVACARYGGRRTLLVDLDLAFGDVAVALDVRPDRTISDLVNEPGEIVPEKLEAFLTRHTSGVDILAAPARPEDAELVDADKVGEVLTVGRATYDVVVVDTAPVLNAPLLAALDRTDDLLLVVTLDVPTLKDVRQSLETLDLVGFPSERVSPVLNRSTARVGISRRDVEAALGMRMAYTLPEDAEVPVSVNRGNPVVLSAPTTEFSRSLFPLMHGLLRPAKGERPKVMRAS